MKRFAILSMTFMFAASIMMGQTTKTEKVQVKETKKELKTEKEALRKLEDNMVSDKAKTNFYTDFGNVPNVQWRKSTYFYEASFTKGGQPITAFYDFDLKLVGTTSHKTFADLPASGQKEIKTRYKDYTIGPVVFFDDNEANDTDMYLYGVQFADAANYFVELTKGTNKIVLEVNPEGGIAFFTEVK
jgi:hypothetical protein